MVYAVGIEPTMFLMSRVTVCRHTTNSSLTYFWKLVLPRGVEPRSNGWKPFVLTDRRWQRWKIRWTSSEAKYGIEPSLPFSRRARKPLHNNCHLWLKACKPLFSESRCSLNESCSSQNWSPRWESNSQYHRPLKAVALPVCVHGGLKNCTVFSLDSDHRNSE